MAGDGDVRRRGGGLETRLGEAVLTVLQREGGDGLAGVVVMTDGASNAGTDPGAARQLAVNRKVRLFAVGVGSLALPDNVQLVNVQAPTDVHVGDAHELELRASVRIETLDDPARRVVREALDALCHRRALVERHLRGQDA